MQPMVDASIPETEAMTSQTNQLCNHPRAGPPQPHLDNDGIRPGQTMTVPQGCRRSAMEAIKRHPAAMEIAHRPGPPIRRAQPERPAPRRHLFPLISAKSQLVSCHRLQIRLTDKTWFAQRMAPCLRCFEAAATEGPELPKNSGQANAFKTWLRALRTCITHRYANGSNPVLTSFLAFGQPNWTRRPRILDTDCAPTTSKI